MIEHNVHAIIASLTILSAMLFWIAFKLGLK